MFGAMLGQVTADYRRPRLPLPHEVEILRRSAAMAPLPPNDVVEALEALAIMAGERATIRRLLDELATTSFPAVRTALNDLRQIVER